LRQAAQDRDRWRGVARESLILILGYWSHRRRRREKGGGELYENLRETGVNGIRM
jgi:hypothetical protein